MKQLPGWDAILAHVVFRCDVPVCVEVYFSCNVLACVLLYIPTRLRIILQFAVDRAHSLFP